MAEADAPSVVTAASAVNAAPEKAGKAEAEVKSAARAATKAWTQAKLAAPTHRKTAPAAVTAVTVSKGLTVASVVSARTVQSARTEQTAPSETPWRPRAPARWPTASSARPRVRPPRETARTAAVVGAVDAVVVIGKSLALLKNLVARKPRPLP